MRSLRLIPIAAAVLLAGPAHAQFNAEVQGILDQIKTAGKCRVHSECVVVAESLCPYGCTIVANSKQKKKLLDLLREAPQPCKLTCTAPEGKWATRCVKGRCMYQRTDRASKEFKDKQRQSFNLMGRIHALRPRVSHRPAILRQLQLLERKIGEGKLADPGDFANISRLELDFPAPPRKGK